MSRRSPMSPGGLLQFPQDRHRLLPVTVGLLGNDLIKGDAQLLQAFGLPAAHAKLPAQPQSFVKAAHRLPALSLAPVGLAEVDQNEAERGPVLDLTENDRRAVKRVGRLVEPSLPHFQAAEAVQGQRLAVPVADGAQLAHGSFVGAARLLVQRLTAIQLAEVELAERQAVVVVEIDSQVYLFPQRRFDLVNLAGPP